MNRNQKSANDCEKVLELAICIFKIFNSKRGVGLNIGWLIHEQVTKDKGMDTRTLIISQ